MSVPTNLKASIEPLQYIFFIQYLIQFQNNKIWALIDLKSKVNIIIPVYPAELGLTI